jgi:cytochrome P450
MADRQHEDWDPFSGTVEVDQRSAYDDMRERCPVAYSKSFGWTLFRHEDIERVLHDPEGFSNKVSRHLSVPNGMDPPEHTGYRRLIEPYFSRQQVSALVPRCREIAAELADKLPAGKSLEFIGVFAQPFAARAQCAFLGWPDQLAEPLSRWAVKNRQATREQDRQNLAATADEFTGYVLEMLRDRRQGRVQTDDTDLTARLLRERVHGRPFSDEELVSILRNWTVGEVGTLSAAVGILVHFLAGHPELQQRLRNDPALLPDANEEILRLHNPLVANRRVATGATADIGGCPIHAGERLQLNWIAANRDPRVFANPDEFRLDRDQSRNLLWGSGIHVCPGAPLARMEMCTAMEVLLEQTQSISLCSDHPPKPAQYPASGFETLHVAVC